MPAMALQLPLAVRLVAPVSGADTPSVDRHVTSLVRSLRTRSTAPGGFASASFTFDAPLSWVHDELLHYGRCYVYDTRSGKVVWEGRLETPGRQAGRGAGEAFSVTAIGPSAHAKDYRQPLVYVDRDMTHWRKYAAWASVNTGIGPDPGATDQVTFSAEFPVGLPVTNAVGGQVRYSHLAASGMSLGRYDYTHGASGTTTDFVNRSDVSLDGASVVTVRSDTWGTNQGSVPKVAGTHFAVGKNTLDLYVLYVGATTSISGSVGWGAIRNVVVMPELFNGPNATALEPANSYLTADQVVWDLLGRILSPVVQLDQSTVAASTYHIEQMAYIDGTDPQTVLDDLMLLEPTFYWAMWESNPFTGRHRFEWLAWPSSVRYEASTVDGFDSPAPGDDIYNSVCVRWRDAGGKVQTVTRTSSPAILARVGLTRAGYIDLGDEVGSMANAQQIGDQFLAQHATPQNAGTLTVSRPIYDGLSGCMVEPWLIRPGHLIRVRGVVSSVSALNANDRDGSTVFRVKSVEFDSDSGSAVLELDAYTATVARSLADLMSRNLTRRR